MSKAKSAKRRPQAVNLVQFLRPSCLLASGGVWSLGIIQLGGLKGKDTLSLNQSRQTWDMRSLSFLCLAVYSVPFLFSVLSFLTSLSSLFLRYPNILGFSSSPLKVAISILLYAANSQSWLYLGGTWGGLKTSQHPSHISTRWTQIPGGETEKYW